MIKLANFNIDNTKINENIISWEILPTTEDLNNYKLDIYRSEFIGDSSLDGFNLIASGINVSQNYYIDFTISGWTNFSRTWYYKIKLKNISNNAVVLYPEIGSYYPNYNITDRATLEILRRKKLVLRQKYVGQNFKFLKRKNWGEHCPKCWDNEMFRSTDDSCRVCYGTGWKGGFFKPIPFIGMVNKSPSYSQINMFGTWKPSDVMLYLLNYPILTERDIIVDSNGKRWSVIQIRYVAKLDKIIEQQAQLALIAPDSIIYEIEV